MVNISRSETERILVDGIGATDHCTARWRCRVLDCTERDDHVDAGALAEARNR